MTANAIKPTPTSAPESVDSTLPAMIRTLGLAGGALINQASLHGQLVMVEWAEEKNRLLKMHVVMLLGFACLLCVMLLAGALALAFSWETPYRIPTTLALIAIYGFGTHVAWRRFQILSARGNQAFAATREELAADLALFKSSP